MNADPTTREDRMKAAREIWPDTGDGWMPFSVREWVDGRGEPQIERIRLRVGAKAFMHLRLIARTPDNRNWLDNVYGVLADVPASDFAPPPDPRDARIADLEREKEALERQVAEAEAQQARCHENCVAKEGIRLNQRS